MTKPPRPSFLSQNYLAMAHGVRELHRLAAQGLDDSPEADAIRDATDGPWALLTPAERKRVGLMSEDLYSLVEPPPPTEPMNPQARAKLAELAEARKKGDWDRALDLLRRWRAFIDPVIVSYLRGGIWLDAGDPATAALFFEHASKLRPEDEHYRGLHLQTLGIVDRPAARSKAAEILSDPGKFRPDVVAYAAEIELSSANASSASEAGNAAQRIGPILKEALARSDKQEWKPGEHFPYVLIVMLLATCFRIQDEPDSANYYYSLGLQVEPYNIALLTARGSLLYGDSPQAVADLELAVRRGSTQFLPFVLLAHHYLLTGNFDMCRKMCERALDLEGSPAVKSEVAEWLAVAQAELRFPAELVRASFEGALQYDPTNERARRNLAVYESASSQVSMDRWETRTASSLQASSFAELRYPQVA